ncbi:MAG: hypothetical protein IIV43_00340, partial [Oscillospiraceae bacterium]|nr:hypothetical protein [Oscillospiraceae bacterium]
IAADFGVSLLRKITNIPMRRILGAAIVFLCTVSAVLTLGRECVAEYRLMEHEQVLVGEYVMEYTDPRDKILTTTRHNNVIAALTGRNIQCGSGSYVYFHGLDYREQEAAVRVMYEEPALYPDVFDYYDIDYIMVSPYEQHEFNVDEATIASRYPCVYDCEGVRLYQVK